MDDPTSQQPTLCSRRSAIGRGTRDDQHPNTVSARILHHECYSRDPTCPFGFPAGEPEPTYLARQGACIGPSLQPESESAQKPRDQKRSFIPPDRRSYRKVNLRRTLRGRQSRRTQDLFQSTSKMYLCKWSETPSCPSSRPRSPPPLPPGLRTIPPRFAR